MDMIVEKYTFYNDGNLYINKKRSLGKRQYEDIPEKADLSIIIVGTEEQNNVLFRKYIKRYDLALDECYDLTNNIRKMHLDTLKKRYINNNKKAYFLLNNPNNII
tara:strand:+ start:1222 stop:1536 length:315 start_codon:yes stop_codon:yes gene_type:complete